MSCHSAVGKLNKRVTIKSLSVTQDTFGEPLETYTDVVTVWASIEPLVGKEYYAAEQANTEVKIKVRMRYVGGINDKMVVFFGSRKLLIVSPPINPYERNQDLILMCKELS